MSNKDNFGSGFILGTIVGGVVGGIVGSLISSKNQQNKESGNTTKTPSYSSIEDDFAMENARLSLEEKINQLNYAIDEVKLGLVAKNQTETEKN